MPFYEYVCGSCGCEFEALQNIKDLPLKNCERCGKPTVTKLVSAAGFRLKGGGWYETDFKKETDKKKNLVTNESPSPSPAVVTPPSAKESKVESTD